MPSPAERLSTIRFLLTISAGGGSRTHTTLLGSRDFKSRASASFATPACNGINSLRGLLSPRSCDCHAICPCRVVQTVHAYAQIPFAANGVRLERYFPSRGPH